MFVVDVIYRDGLSDYQVQFTKKKRQVTYGDLRKKLAELTGIKEEWIGLHRAHGFSNLKLSARRPLSRSVACDQRDYWKPVYMTVKKKRM